MRRIDKAKKNRPRPRFPEGGVSSLVSRPLDAGTFLLKGGEKLESTCLNCPDQPCIKFAEGERLQGTVAESVCPVEAISFNLDHTDLEVRDRCFSCGLCVLRCPFDSLSLLEDSQRPALGKGPLERYEAYSSEAFNQHAANLEMLVQADNKDIVIDQLVANAAETTQDEFYPLVANLLTALGLPTTLPPGGDTNNRIDGLIFHNTHSAPVEIKSPTETEAVNIKSVQQALENKVILDERHSERYPSTPDTTSLAIAYTYPNDRSGVTELIEDVFSAYGIRIGMLSLRSLYELIWEKYVARSDPDFSKLLVLKGRFGQ